MSVPLHTFPLRRLTFDRGRAGIPRQRSREVNARCDTQRALLLPDSTIPRFFTERHRNRMNLLHRVSRYCDRR
jgi:hypothetical protein